MKEELKNYLKQISNKTKTTPQNTKIENVGNIFNSQENFTSY